MSTMNTFTGKIIDPMQLDTKNICTEDIAHALCLTCRGGGHLKYFYSVGQHSLNCMQEARSRGYSRRVQLACLLHDTSEAYIADIIRPVKAHLSNYLEIEAIIMDCIWKKYGLDDLNKQEQNQWKQIDDDILAYELHHLMNGEIEIQSPALSSVPDILEKNWRIVESDFIKEVNQLIQIS